MSHVDVVDLKLMVVVGNMEFLGSTLLWCFARWRHGRLRATKLRVSLEGKMGRGGEDVVQTDCEEIWKGIYYSLPHPEEAG